MPGPTESDLIFSQQANNNFSKTLNELKRSTLTISNRLQSVQQDAAFAQRVGSAYGRPLIANERCGSWYIDPEHKAGSAYFKSTDGHTGVWKLSTRRLNLQLLEIIGKHDGCVIVDSTRRGKRMPDALSKTIPIWCSVLNRLVFPHQTESHDLYTPPQVVSRSEHAQIAHLLPSFLASLQSLNLSIDSLKSQISKPLRPIWVTPDSNLAPAGADSVFEDFHPIICCTVSRMVVGGEVSEGGYIQGAGDDTENWAHGLTAPLFWANHETLLSTAENDLPDLIEELVRQSSASSGPGSGGDIMTCLKPTTCLFVGSLRTLLDSGTALCAIRLLPKVTEESTWQTSATQMEVGLGPHKIGSRNLRTALPVIISFVMKSLHVAKEKGGLEDKRIILSCESGKDLSIGLGLVLLCLLFDEDGCILLLEAGSSESERPKIDKIFIRRRLAWISNSIPDVNPSRATLRSVNDFLMDHT